MKSLGWSWLLLAAIPGCLLVEPLDAAVSSDSGGDSSSSAGASTAGSNSGSHAGSGNSHAGSPGGRAGAPGSSGAPGTSGAPSTDGKLAPFLGTWNVKSGSFTITCPGADPVTQDATGVETWTPGTESDLLQPGFEGNCDFKANVSGRTATGLPGQTCVETSTDASSGDNIAQDFSIDTFKFVVSADGTSATQTFAGTDDYADLTTRRYATCTFTETTTLTM